MIALAATVLVFLYLFLPSVWFRFHFGSYVPLNSFVRTKTDEIFQSARDNAIPFVLAWILVWYVPLSNKHPFYVPGSVGERRQDYKLVTGAIYSEQDFRDSKEQFWKALTRTGRRQLRFLFWYYILIAIEGRTFGLLAVRYGKTKRGGLYSFLAKKLIFRDISEWHLILTPFLFSGNAVVQADILSAEDMLYQGKVSNYYLDKEGQLSGLILTDPRRFDRRSYQLEKDKGTEPDKEKYWRPIPSARLYFFADKILNLNINYHAPSSLPDILVQLLNRKFKPGVSLAIETKSSDTSASSR